MFGYEKTVASPLLQRLLQHARRHCEFWSKGIPRLTTENRSLAEDLNSCVQIGTFRSGVLYPSGQEDAVEPVPVRMMEVMLGIPGVRLTGIDAQPTGLRVEFETSATSATCPICRNEVEPARVEVVDLGEPSAKGQCMHLE
jgi:hypothetical protein